jgi:23S rRNA (pseudouridine1915-N3)-methyltransferase
MALQLQFAAVQNRGKATALADASSGYVKRMKPHAAATLPTFETEDSLLEEVSRQRTRTAPFLVLMDSRGKAMSSEAFAAWLGRERDGGRQSIVFAIGPASGWSDEARGKADLLLSLGPMTLPHELARLVLVEQVYRAFTILSGHPYHTGH